ncbi:MAG: serine/threonine-protein kinase [Kofleriaceae bacterium]
MGVLSIGTTFADRYQILALLGRGGMGEVYRAEHLALGNQVALKILGPELEGAREERFEREARTTARLNHPGCVRVLDYGRAEQLQFIAMELVDGQNLATVLRDEGPFSTARAARVGKSLLAALAHAHENGVLHRDVKPANVMLVTTGAPRCVLIDFGLARLRDDGPLTAVGTCMGSPSYLSPERLLGRDYDARADLYAVGVILYELLAGAKPFPGDSPREIMQRLSDRPPRPLRAIRNDVSRSLDAVIMRALAKDPARRFPDAETMLGALDDVPVLERLAELRAITARDEEAPTHALAQLSVYRPSRLRRIWSWLRYGGWRRRDVLRDVSQASGAITS